MASSFFLLLDDIASVLDDVALLTKVATKKTAGVLGDDLALNAEQVTGVSADRELPVVWAVAKGSLINKAILVPGALALSVWAPALIQPLLILGGAFLCFEGAEKILHKWLHAADTSKQHKTHIDHLKQSPKTLLQLEKDKIRGAIRTDFILSAEIVVITLGTVTEVALPQKIGTLVLISLAMTVGVYGLVAAIVKMDDVGLALSQRTSAAARSFGMGILKTAPLLMKSLSVIGTIAMFMVGGGILAHAWPWFHHLTVELSTPIPTITEALLGLIVGILIVGVVTMTQKTLKSRNN